MTLTPPDEPGYSVAKAGWEQKSVLERLLKITAGKAAVVGLVGYLGLQAKMYYREL